MKLTTRDDRIEQEHEHLSDQASFSDRSLGRDRASQEDRFRSTYQKDRDKILHTKAFRRLSHKTQVFLAPVGDHYRTRLTHTLEVSQIARTIARALGLNEDLTEAIALGHDLGHTPFGHVGEESISRCLALHRGLDPEAPENKVLYRHNIQSLRVVEVIENEGKGLTLSEDGRDGIVHHTGSERAKTYEGRIVATADRIAYVNHDIDDALRSGVLKESDLPESTHRIIGENHADRIQTLVEDMIVTSDAQGDIAMSEPIWEAMMELRSFLFDKVYTSDQVMREVYKARHLVEDLFNYFVRHYDEVPAEYRALAGDDPLRAVTDHVAGMTDRYAINFFEDMFVPKSWNAQH